MSIKLGFDNNFRFKSTLKQQLLRSQTRAMQCYYLYPRQLIDYD
jgi:hypothetical protein